MQTYKEFRPTGFDPRGLNAEALEIGEYLVLPCGRNRDSGCLSESNFRMALARLGGESGSVQVRRFGHWGCGWFEIILINPSDETALNIAEDIESDLEDYCVLDESDYSDLEHERAYDYWQSMSIRERVDLCREYKVSCFAARHDTIPDDSTGELYLALTE